MRWIFVLFALALWAQMEAGAQKPTQLFGVDGIIVRPRTKQPVKKASVTITRNDRRNQQASVMTGEDGTFHFTDVPPGKYTLTAESHGVNRTFQEDGGYSTGIAVGQGLDSGHIVFPLPAPTSLTVEVFDEEGEPVRNAQVMLFERRIEAGWAQVRSERQENSDDEGRVRWSRLEGGSYYVGAGGRPWYAQSMRGAQSPESEAATKELDVAYPTTYFPATANPEEAAPIEVAEGEEVTRRIVLRTVPAVKMILDTGGSQNTSMSVQTIGPGGTRVQANASFFSTTDGPMEFRGLAPGTYLVSRLSWRQEGGPARSSGTALVSVAGDTQFSAASFQKTEVLGRVSVEGGKKLDRVAIWLNAPETNLNMFCPVGPDGVFRCDGQGGSLDMSGGNYQLRLMSSGLLYIKSVAAQGATLSGGLLHVSHGASVQLAITAAPGLTNLNGITLRGGKPYAAAMVLLVPQGSDPGNGIPRDQSDSDGTFTLPDVHPGRYLLLAIDHGRGLEYHNSRVLEPYLSHAQTVDIPAPGVNTDPLPVQVNVQPRLKP